MRAPLAGFCRTTKGLFELGVIELGVIELRTRAEPPNRWRVAVGLLAFVTLLLFASTTPAGSGSGNIHPVSVVEADVYVNRFRTTMRLKCFAEDLELLQGVEPLEDGFYDPEEMLDATQDHAEYLAQKITLRDRDGELMPATVTEIVDIEIPPEGIRAGTLMGYKMEFVLEFTYEEPPPFLTIQQDMVADGALLPSELKILLKQAGNDKPDTHMMKPRSPKTFQFDWDNAVLSEDFSPEEREEWFAKQHEKNLGISSYGSVYSFVYITDSEVRHEVLVPLATLTTLMEIDRADESFLDVSEQLAAAEKIKAYFSVGNPVVIDGIEVKPVFDRVDFYGLDLTDFAIQAERRRVSMANGRVGVIMSYSTQGPPTTVSVSWDKFNTVIRSVDSIVFAYDEVEKTQFSMFLKNNTFDWQSPEREPLPPITGVTAALDLESLKPPTLTLPLLSIGVLALASLLLLLGKPLMGISVKRVLATGVGLVLFAIAALPFFQRVVSNPFAPVPKFSIDDDDADQVFSQLHKNMFRAFDYRAESDVYDALAKSVNGELLRELYLQINRSLKIKEQGGAVARINEVNLLEGGQEKRSAPAPLTAAFEYRCRWNLVGTIEHWGHIHQRTNQYEAKFEVRVQDDAWKIISMTMLDEQQGQVKTSLRKF